jgi:dipeptidyl aminopeptidase/acylaminoacyl peptidase
VDVKMAEISPDGSLVAVVVLIGEPEGHGRSEIRLVPVNGDVAGTGAGAGTGSATGTRTGAGTGTLTLTAEDGDAGSVRWSGDGRLAFLADHGHRHLSTPWLAERGTDGRWAKRELACPPGVPEHLRWSPDGTRLLLTMAGLGAEQADGLGSGKLGQDLEQGLPPWWPEVESSDGGDEWRSAWTLRVADGATARVSPDGLNVWEADWLGNEAAVAVVTDGPAEDAWYRARLVRLGPAPGEVVTLHVPEWQIQFAEGSPDGSRVAVIEGVASDRYFTVGDVVVAQADGSGSRSLGWLGADVGAVRWTGPRSLVAAGQDGLDRVLLRVETDAAGDAALEAFRTDANLGGGWCQVSAAGARVALILNGRAEPPRAVIVEGGHARTILGTEHPGRDIVRRALTRTEAIAWPAPDGTSIDGILTLPEGEGPFPTVLWVHGGPVGAVGFGFRSPLAALLVEAGYAVIDPNPRGSTGRGRAFAAAVVGDMGGPADTGDLLAALDHLVAEGIADPDRLAVGGVSYGGYMAALLPAIDDRFAAAIVGSPLTDLVSSYYGSSLTVFVHDYVGGRPDAALDRYVERSSVFAGSRLRTPSLVSVGLRDRATPPGQAMEHFRALREQGTPAELLQYPQEGHGVRAIEARMDWTARVVLWLERFVPPHP